MADRISRKPDVLVNQCNLAAAGIGQVGAGWPASAPTMATMQNHQGDIANQLTSIASLEAQLRTARQELAALVETARADMLKIDQATDLLYGTEGGQTVNFGLPPKGGTGAAAGTPEQVVVRAIADGTHPASIFVDWDSVDGSVYEMQWFSDAELTKLVGTQTVTSSELEVAGLTRGSQYWFRVRAVRAGQSGPWSDQATRVANI